MPGSEGSYYLVGDVTLSYMWKLTQGTTNLCLNGHKIVQTVDDMETISIRPGATLNFRMY